MRNETKKEATNKELNDFLAANVKKGDTMQDVSKIVKVGGLDSHQFQNMTIEKELEQMTFEIMELIEREMESFVNFIMDTDKEAFNLVKYGFTLTNTAKREDGTGVGSSVVIEPITAGSIFEDIESVINDPNNEILFPTINQDANFAPFVLDALKKYIKNTFQHKKDVFSEGLGIISNVPNLTISEHRTLVHFLIIHDLSKLNAYEALRFANHFFIAENKLDFAQAFKVHCANNPHHPEHYMLLDKTGKIEVLPMPKLRAIEMVCDWSGASKTYKGNFKDWAKTNYPTILLHELTREYLDPIIELLIR